MIERRVEATLWGLTVAFVAAAGVSVWHSTAAYSSAHVESPRAAAGAPVLQPLTERALAQSVSADLFRIARHPSPIEYKPELEGIQPPPPAPKPPEPALVLAGILGGPPWEALLDGIPGHDGSILVHQGDVLGALRIRSVTRDSVIVQGADTTWRLALRSRWQ